MSSVCYVQCLLCLVFVMSSVCYVQCLLCPVFFMSSVFYVQCLLCPVFVMSSVCLSGFVVSSVCLSRVLRSTDWRVAGTCVVYGSARMPGSLPSPSPTPPSALFFSCRHGRRGSGRSSGRGSQVPWCATGKIFILNLRRTSAIIRPLERIFRYHLALNPAWSSLES